MAFKHISSVENPIFKHLKRLSKNSRERKNESKTLLDGAHLVNDYIKTYGDPLQIIIAEGKSTYEVTNLIQDLADVPTIMLPTLMFSEISPVASPTGILALVDVPKQIEPSRQNFVLFLEDIQDPGNLGSILRSAVAANVDVVYLSIGCAEAWSPKALRGGQGAQFGLTIIENSDLINRVKNFEGQVLATCLDGVSIYTQDLKLPTAFLIGNEGSGLSEALIQLSTRQISIPMSGKVESLNVAAATAICLFERVRQNSLDIS